MMPLWDALRMNMMISYQELVRTFLANILLRINNRSLTYSALGGFYLYVSSLIRMPLNPAL